MGPIPLASGVIFFFFFVCAWWWQGRAKDSEIQSVTRQKRGEVFLFLEVKEGKKSNRKNQTHKNVKISKKRKKNEKKKKKRVGGVWK